MGKPTISENEFLKQVIELAHLYHWRCAHFRTAMSQSGQYITPVQADGAGFPDLVMARAKRLIIAELKTEKGKLSPKQIAWIDALDGIEELYVWRPSDLNEIAEILR